ncbi:MAG TPA: hypothetical protein VNL91_09800 [Thermoanaerobaculia bacterium]|nr:hypothetical protein [Thermoanaerobaculia bacterium]
MAASHDSAVRRCHACGTLFESGVADPHPSGEPRCPQCFLPDSTAADDLDTRDTVIRTTTPFR